MEVLQYDISTTTYNLPALNNDTYYEITEQDIIDTLNKHPEFLKFECIKNYVLKNKNKFKLNTTS